MTDLTGAKLWQHTNSGWSHGSPTWEQSRNKNNTSTSYTLHTATPFLRTNSAAWGDESSDDNLKCPGSSRNKTVCPGLCGCHWCLVAHNGPGHSQHQSQYYLPHRPQSQVTSNGEYNGPAHHSGTYGDIVYTTWPHVFMSMTGARTFTWCVTLPTQLSRPAITSIFKHFIFGILNIHNLLF